ncbi:response regulator transcription factor [Geobacter sp. AOG2]|uniref:response regulator n=1 Tax=Geobacter sp. AOG2 TaxID=1566347 RepID=UPI001CC57B44|nr:response regulator transcription factor [Geobacter sp. AOG2]GFE60751.1 DNA-binding response regulator [Geobacter sp. AOG2]
MRIVLVEDNTVTRETLNLLLSGETTIDSVTTFGSGEELLAHIEYTAFDVLLVDLDLPGMHGSELIQKVKQMRPQVEIMVYTIFEDRENVFSAIKSGASGYILKGSSPRDLIESLQSLHQGGAPMSPKIARKVILEFQKVPDGDDNPLTSRESCIVRSIEQGLTYKEIAERFNISPHTVHTHIKNIYEKLQAHGRQDALKRARRIGII